MDIRKPGSLSQTSKAIKLRNERLARRNEKHFNAPLRAFLEYKYPTIYAEYTELYQLMSTTHPERRKLVSKSTFKQWKATNSPVVMACDDVLTQALQETLTTEILEQNSTQQDSPQITQPHDQDMHPQIQDSPQDSPQEVENINEQIDNIINQLEMDEAVRNMLEQPNPVEDEGIVLDPFEEILDDIQEFDYELEVDPV